MADTFKILSQTMPDDTSETLAYTVPSQELGEVTSSAASGAYTVSYEPKAVSRNVQTIVTSIIICNHHSGALTYSIRLKEAAASGGDYADNDKEWLFKTTAITNANTQILSLGLGLSGGNLIKVQSSLADKLSFTIMGIEVT